MVVAECGHSTVKARPDGRQRRWTAKVTGYEIALVNG